MKKVLLILSILLICGCTSRYELDISNNSFKENIDISAPKYDYTYEKAIDPVTGAVVEDDNQFEDFLEDSTSALFSKKSNYKKKVTYNDQYVNINMKYNYSEKEFSDSNSLKLCFEKSNFEYDKTYYIHAYGYFYCLYSDTLDIVIHTRNKVIKNNADEVSGNNYIWHINESNRDNVNIEFEAKKGISIFDIMLIIIAIIALAVIYYVIKLARKRNLGNNEI